MTTNNPLSEHTDGSNDGLTDGSHILSPSLTNLYEGVHGNGVLLPHDTAYGDSDRNDPPDLPGAISAGANVYSFVVKACDVILDGVLYAIGGGSDVTVTLSTTTTEKLGTFTALTTGQECLFVVLATPDGVKVTQSNRITSATGAYPSISGTTASYLKTGSGAGDNRQTVVLGTVRATFNGSAVTANNLDLTISERNDKRVFVRPSPFYLSPVRDGTISSTTGINGHTALSTVHTGQTGNFGDNGIIWQSFNSANESMLYYSRKDASNRHTHLLGPTNINVSSPSGNLTFTFDSDQVFVLTASTTINLNPSGTFPPGHTVFVSVPSGSTVTFDSSGLNQAIAAGNALMFAYDGSNWKRVLFSSTVSTTASGASGVVQLSDGAGGFTSDTTLSYDTAANELIVDGKLTVSGLIDPTGLELTPQASNPAAADGDVVDANTLWLDSGASNRLKQGAAGVMRAGDNISELTNDSAFVNAAGAASAAPAANLTYTAATRVVASSTGTNATLTEVVAGGNSGLMTGAQATKLDGIETSATADQTDAEIRAAVEAASNSNVFTDADHSKLNAIEASATADQTDAEIRDAVEAATDSNVFTDADHSKLNGIAAGATAYTDANAIAAVEGEATLALAGDVTIAAGKGLIVDGDTLHVDATNDRVGIGTSSPATALHVEGANKIIRVKDTSAGDTALTRTMGGIELSAAGMNTTSKFGVPIKFMSTDSAFTTENPKFLAAIVPIARESYTADTKGGMAIGFAVTAKNAGASSVPQVAMTLDSNGRLGIGSGGPQAPLHVLGTIRQTTVTNAVLVADANGDLTAASNLADLAYEVFTPVTSGASWAGAAPTTLQTAIDRLAAYVVTIPGAPPQIP